MSRNDCFIRTRTSATGRLRSPTTHGEVAAFRMANGASERTVSVRSDSEQDINPRAQRYPAEAESQPKLARELYCPDLEQINQYALHVTSTHADALTR
jgi:hypothetical protein